MMTTYLSDMSIEAKIEDLLFRNPDEEYAVEDIALKFDTTEEYVRNALRRLIKRGRLGISTRTLTVVSLSREWRAIARGLDA